MDPLSICASAIALITACHQTGSKIQKIIETVKGAKRELMSVAKELDMTKRLLEQLRALTHHLGSKNVQIFLDFDRTDCEGILEQLEHLVDKFVEAGRLVGFQFLVKKNKFEELASRLRAQREWINTVFLSITTDSAVFTRDFVQMLSDGTNVKAASLSSIIQTSVGPISKPSAASTAEEKPPRYTEQSSEEAKIDLELTGDIKLETAQKDLLSNVEDRNTASHVNEDPVSISEENATPLPTALNHSDLRSDASLLDTNNDDRTSRIVFRKQSPSRNLEEIDPDPPTRHSSRTPAGAAIWHGQLSRAFYDNEELALRDSLADAAFYGDWDDVEEIIDNALGHGLGSISNCYRLTSNLYSGWTPLHQAAFFSAPEHVVKMLVERGASRMLQTIWASPRELPHKNMTALEIAQCVGSKHLYEILSPVVRHSIPYSTLQRVQQNFHDLIRGDIVDRPEYSRLRLPELDLLTELENPEMFFPLSSRKIATGYFYRLDGRELLVASLGILSPESHVYYRITERSIREIEDAILFDVT